MSDAERRMDPTDEEVDRYIAGLAQPIVRYGVAYCPFGIESGHPYDEVLDLDTIGYHCSTCGYRIPWELLGTRDEMGDEETWK